MTDYAANPNLAAGTEPGQAMEAHVPVHEPGVAHHFDDAEQQREASTLGMWTFLATEVMFFGGVFAGYLVFRGYYYNAFVEGASHLKQWLATVNTIVLLTSSFSVALAVRASHLRDRTALTRWLWVTVGLGALFLVFKAYEYLAEWHEQLVPGLNWFQPEAPREMQLFFVFYFTMTAIHATHMIIGIVLMGISALRARQGAYDLNANYVEGLGLYWHFVDIVWIFLFPLLYLIEYRAGH